MSHRPVRSALLMLVFVRVTTNVVRTRDRDRRRRRFVDLEGTLGA